MVQERGTARAGRGHDGGRPRIEGERAQVLDDHEVGVGQRAVHLGPGGWLGRVDRQPR